MKNLVLKITIVLTLLFLAISLTQNVKDAKANPVNVYSVPDVEISFPLVSTGGYVNNTVQFEVYVYLSTDSQKPSVSYSLDGQSMVNLEDLRVRNCYDLVYAENRTEKMNFKKYTSNLILEDLSEGSHTLIAYANNMSDSQNFTVNSHYVIAKLEALSPKGQFYSNTVPLTFSINGEIKNAHYYLYKNDKFLEDNALSGNTTLDQLSEGNYDLQLFVTTQYGQRAETIHFSISNDSPPLNFPIIETAIILIVLSVVTVLLIIDKRNISKMNKLTMLFLG